jgi:endonuclease/exonuclease/phosphatase family metal-dependent hydrolase
VRVVSANLQHGVPNPKGPPDLGRGLPLLAALAGDVYGFQELDRGVDRTDRQRQPEVLAEHLGGELVWAPALRRGGGAYGNALVVRGRVLVRETLALPGGGEPRTAALALAEIDGRPWSIATAHLSLDHRTAIRQVLAIVDAMARFPWPRVVLGDCNLTPTRLLPISTAEGYQLVPGANTINARGRLDRRLDHVLLQGAAAVKAGVARLPISDHLAIWADLRPVSSTTP